jgi:7-cyano-7-deazaguanine tRNA-ribosyltransferase
MAEGGVFEVGHWDGAARGGRLAVPGRGTVDTPALLPVVNPNRPTVPGADLAPLGAQIAITNAYVLYDDPELRDAARERGVHDLIGFDGPVMTDSGAFQLAEYGDIDASNDEILAFQREIGVDIATPVDLPTPPDADHETAAAELETTADRVAAAVEGASAGGSESPADGASGDGPGSRRGPLVAAPVQGGTHPGLRTRAAERVADIGGDVYPVGGVVPLLRDYRFADVVRVTRAAKEGLPLDAPVHLFGAGHPMAFALAAACGCDLFDSAAYALYAREDRYLTVSGTRDLADIDEFPCACPMCTERTPAALRDRSAGEREALLARHNLHVSFAECRRVREAIRTGDLFELLEQRARTA